MGRGGWRSPPPVGRLSQLVLQIADIVDADDVPGCVSDRVVSGDVWLPENRRVAIVRLDLLDHWEHRTVRVQHGADRTRTVVLLHVGGDAYIVVARFHEQSRRSAVFLNNRIDL